MEQLFQLFFKALFFPLISCLLGAFEELLSHRAHFSPCLILSRVWEAWEGDEAVAGGVPHPLRLGRCFGESWGM